MNAKVRHIIALSGAIASTLAACLFLAALVFLLVLFAPELTILGTPTGYHLSSDGVNAMMVVCVLLGGGALTLSLSALVYLIAVEVKNA
jgi:uncharacterized membrane protein